MVNPLDFLGKIIAIKIDRPLGSRHPNHGFLYLLNYGYVPGVLAPDGEELDAYVLGVFEPVAEFEGRCIAVIHRLDDDDDKLVLAPDGVQYVNEQILALTEFQERFFKSTIFDRGNMNAVNFDQTIEKYHQANIEFNKGNAASILEIFTERDDVSLAQPLGPTARGRKQVVETAQRNASYFRDGESLGFENIVKSVSSDFAFIVENERYKVKVGGSQDFDRITLRVTSIFRLEDGGWKMVHRHADPIVSNQPLESLIQKKT